MAAATLKPITVLIPTFRRPESLARALASVAAQHGAALIQEIVVVDNDPEGSARETVERARAGCTAPLIYVHAPQPGVATARNAGLRAVTAPYVAFLDDDEAAYPDWLGALFDTHLTFEADVTFGPVQGRAPGAAAWKRTYLERFFSRTGPAASGLIDAVYGCGNSLMTRASALKGPEPFDLGADQTGGEDDRLFSKLKPQGARFAWAAGAVVEEHAPAARATLAYAFTRAVSFGQSPSKLALWRGDWLGVIQWMVIGAGQALVYGAASLALLLTFNRGWIDMADRSARGIGKVVWFKDFYFYGEGAAIKTPAALPPKPAAPFTPAAAIKKV